MPIHKCGLAGSDRNIARIERAKVLLRQDRAAVFRRLEIEIDEFMHSAALQEAQHLAQGQRRGHGADERRADGLAGEQRDATAIERSARELGVAEQVTFAGSQTNEAVAALMARSSVLLAPSVVARDGNRESGLIVVKEAAAAGTVPIGTRHGGIPDSIDDGQTGFLVAERDVQHMGERLAQVLTDESLRARLAEAGRRKMEREFDNRKLVAELEDIYDEVARERGVPRG